MDYKEIFRKTKIMQFLKWFSKKPPVEKQPEIITKKLNVILDEKSIGFDDNLSTDEVAEVFLGFFTGVYLDGLHQYITIKHPEAIDKIKLAMSALASMQSVKTKAKSKTVNKNAPLIQPLMNIKPHE